MRGPHVERRRWKLPDGQIQESPFWSLVFYRSGRRVYRRTNPPTTLKRVAEEQLRAALGGAGNRGVQTVGEALKAYREHLTSSSPSTARAFGAVIRRLTDALGTTPAARLTLADVDRVTRELRAKGYSTAYVETHRRMLKSALRRLPASELPLDHPGRLIPVAAAWEPRRAVWHDDELNDVCAHLAPWASALARFLRYSGLRIGDALRLRWSDLRGDAVTFRVQKSGKETIIPLSARAAAVLVELPHCSPWIFPSETLETPRCRRSFARLWYPALVKAKVSGRTVHDLRRTFAQELHRSGVPDRMIAALLGQETTSVVPRYSWPELDVMRRAVEAAANCGGLVAVPRRTPADESLESTTSGPAPKTATAAGPRRAKGSKLKG